MQGFNVEHLQEKWAPILNHEGLGGINDAHKRMVTAVLLENQEKTIREEREFLSEAAPTNATGSSIDNFDPVLISLIRRAMPNLVAYDLAGVQPMNGPTGLIFAMRSRFTSQGGDEALFDEADTGFSNSGIGTANPYVTGQEDGVGFGTTGAQAGSNPGLLDPTTQTDSNYTVQQGMDTAQAEGLGATGDNNFNEMAFSIEKVTVTKNHAL